MHSPFQTRTDGPIRKGKGKSSGFRDAGAAAQRRSASVQQENIHLDTDEVTSGGYSVYCTFSCQLYPKMLLQVGSRIEDVEKN